MLGSILWNSGALSPAFYNVIEDVRDEGTLASSTVGAAALVAAAAHTPVVLAGDRQLGFLGDFYFRFHITTPILDLGNLVSDQTQEVTLWNAYRRAWILDSITLENAEGIEITGQPDPPLQYAPNQERTYELGISSDGPSTIAASITWVFSNGVGVEMLVSGLRIVPWNWAPDWEAGMLERLQWYTDVLPAARGEEQRRSLRIEPRQMLEFTPLVSGVDRRIMETTLWGWGANVWAVPLWFDGQELAATLASGATVIPLDPAMRGYEVGGLVMLTNGDPRTYEMIEIAALGSSITLERATQQTWGPGTRVYPARAAVIENEAQVTRFTGNDVAIRVQWRMVDPTPWEAEATPTYRSLPVLEHRPNWIEDPSLSFDRKTSVFDSGTGKVTVYDNADMPLTSQRMRYTLTSRAEINTWKKRLWALRGKQCPIWIPTWSDDLTVTALIASGATQIDVEWIGYTKYLSEKPNRRDIRIELNNGTIFYRHIESASEISATVERLTIDTALGVTVNIADVALVSFMGASRSDSDQHEFAYFTGDSADTAFTARGFRNEL